MYKVNLIPVALKKQQIIEYMYVFGIVLLSSQVKFHIM